ncbi:pre-toxin TG domain-containing protein, partial [Paenibacillus glacialis]|uniref:pre-toxin TG domain-containing protein n=1 Tax=Paenibacillus glacialis TaxID=494026 RepID=UPI000B30B449
MKIEVEVSSLLSTGKELHRASEDIETLRSELRRAMSGLTLQSRRRPDVDSNYQGIDQRLNELHKELEELSRLSERKGDQFEEADGKGKPFDFGALLKFVAVATSMGLDFVPILGNAKGILEAIVGRDLITGDKLAPWERALAVLGPLGKGVSSGAKLLKVADEVIGVASQATRHGDDVADMAKAVNRAENVGEEVLGQGSKHLDDVHGGKGVDSKTGDSLSKNGDQPDLPTGKTDNNRGASSDLAPDGNPGKNTGTVDAPPTKDGSPSLSEKEAMIAAAATATAAGGGTVAALTKKVKSADHISGSNPISKSDGNLVNKMDAVDSSPPKQTQNPSQTKLESNVKDPIHAATGDQYIIHPAIKLYGAATWSFELHYHSALLQTSDLGVAWTHNYAMRLALSDVEPESITMWWNASRANRFVQQEDGRYRSADLDVQWDELLKTEAGYELITRSPRAVYHFTTEGQLHRHTNAEGLALEVVHNEAGQLLQLVDERTQRALNVNYNGQALIQDVGDPARQVSFSYNEYRHLIRFKDPNRHATDLTYDSDGRIISLAVAGDIQFVNTFDEDDRIIEQSDALGRVTRLHYDTQSRPGFIVTTVTNGLGHEQQLVHDKRYLLIENQMPDGKKEQFTYTARGQEESRTNALGETIRYEYDDQGHLIRVINPLGDITSFTYNYEHLLDQETNAEGHITKYIYDEQQRLVGMTRPEGTTCEITYNAQGQRATYRDFNGVLHHYHYNDVGELSTMEDGEGRATQISYDNVGRITMLEDPLGGQTCHTYDANDNLSVLTDPLGRKWHFSYDAFDRMLEQTNPSGKATVYRYAPTGTLESVTNALGETVSYRYDVEDRLEEHRNALGETTKLRYDRAGRVLTVIDPLDREVQYTYDGAGRMKSAIDGEGRIVKALTYDAAGNPIAETDGLKHTKNIRFNALYQPVEEQDALGRITRMSYDAASRLTEVIEADLAVYRQEYDGEDRLTAYTDANANRTELQYDRSGLLTSEKNAANSVLKYGYDARGWRNERTNARGQRTDYRYDAAGQLIELVDEAGTTKLDYDLNGYMTTVTENEVTTTRTYDDLGRVTAVTGAWGQSIGYTYDAASRITKLTYPDGKEVHYRYTMAGELSEVKDWKGRLTRYRYDRSGRLIETQRPNGSRERRSYDGAGQMDHLSDQTPQGVMMQQYRYTYNAIGQIIQEEDKQYTYDNLRRMSRGSWPGRRIDYSYDLAGNMMTRKDSDQEAYPPIAYTKDNRLFSIGGYPVEMDADGNLLYMSEGKTMASFEYDARNRLVKSGKAQYTYDAQGNRTSMTWKGKTTRYIVDALPELSRVLMELDAEGTPKAYYVYGLGLIGREDTQGNYQSYHSDIRGS